MVEIVKSFDFTNHGLSYLGKLKCIGIILKKNSNYWKV
jgi:hypothetical protein